MRIGLVDVDSFHFPNIALMKISAYHKSRGDIVEWANLFQKYDIVYMSKVFSWSHDDEYCYSADKIEKGGTGYDVHKELPIEIDSLCPDYSLYNCEHAYGFLTRGCPNRCKWCIVPVKEGDIRPYMDIEEFIADKKSAILMDNNVLAHEWGIKQLEKIAKLKIKVDFNQGIDCRRIDASIAKLLAKIRWLEAVRLACDTKAQMKHVEKAVKYMRQAGVKPERYNCYVLVTEDLEDAYERVMFLKRLNIDPYAQAYRDFTLKVENITIEQRRFCRWVNHKPTFMTIDWKDYQKTAPKEIDQYQLSLF